MTWLELIPIIARYGFPFAFTIWQKAQAGGAPTAADFAELRALINKTEAEYDAAAATDPAYQQPS